MYPALEEVVGHAIIDREFCASLLNGKRARLLSQFHLTPEETQALMSIRADSLEAFAGQLYRWIEAQQPRARQMRPA
ncbi:MAG TPA: Os1348 family NHLP clan protein [Anaerolineae bacterium]|nr:Os1348 family NHLP clan protein [Anaerolineae bacterium]